MKHAVIYARYSSEKQNDMSIDGQIAECRRYAEANGLFVIGEYIDRAYSATTDRRPEFKRMIEDSKKKNFDAVIVYQLDRFARNMFDAGYYAKILRDNGAELVSAVEHISGDSAGVITTALILGMAEWYSKQLSEKVTRGMYQNAEQCKHNGSTIPFGYKTDSERKYILDEFKAPIVKEIFTRIANGETAVEIAEDLNKRGIKTAKDRPFVKNSIYFILRNEKYKGIYIYGDVRIPDGMPRIISDELFDEVQEIIGRKHRSHRHAKEEFFLTGVLYCGECKELMTGTAGTSCTGTVYRYYKCTKSPKECHKKSVNKDVIEDLIFNLCKELLTDEVIEDISEAVRKLNDADQESIELTRLKKDIKSTEEKIGRLIDQIENGIASPMISDRLKDREEELETLKRQLKKENSKQVRLSPEMAKKFLHSLKNGDIEDAEYKRMLVRVFIDRIYLYDDKYHIMLKYTDKRTTDRAAMEIERYFDGNSSDLALYGPPVKKPLLSSRAREVFMLHSLLRLWYNYPAGMEPGYNNLREKHMKKHSLLILSILLLIGFFITAWYNDHLFNHLYILVFPLYVVLLVAFIVLLVISIRRIVKQREYFCFIAIAVLSLIVVLAVFFPFRDAKVRYELNRFETDRLEIVEMIKDNRLQPKDEIGNVVLPAGYGRLSSDGEVFIYQNDENGQVIGFWVFRGMLSGSVELIYSSGGEALIRANESGHPITKIENLKGNWYYVETDY